MEQKIKIYSKKNKLNNPDPLFSQILELFNKPFNDLIFEAQTIHRENFDPNKVQLSTLLSIKTGGCSEGDWRALARNRSLLRLP